MIKRRRNEGELKRTTILTLRLTEAEMLRLRLSVLGLKESRSEVVRERIGDLIREAMPSAKPTETDVSADRGGDLAEGKPELVTSLKGGVNESGVAV